MGNNENTQVENLTMCVPEGGYCDAEEIAYYGAEAECPIRGCSAALAYSGKTFVPFLSR